MLIDMSRRMLVAAGLTSRRAAGGGDSATALNAVDVIGIQSLRFKPDHSQVSVGEKVTWRNDASVGHDVKAESGASFSPETFGKNKTFTWTPDRTGTPSTSTRCTRA
jgi:plastocyanin